MKETLIKARQVAEVLGIAVPTVYELVHAKKLPAVVLGRGKRKMFLRFRPSVIEQFIRENETGTGQGRTKKVVAQVAGDAASQRAQ
jgi:excisionase family DNA binding protein